MKLSMFCVYDKKVCVFDPPVTFRNEEEVIRYLRRMLRGPGDSTVKSFPEDYEMYEVGSYDDSDGSIVPLSPVRFVCRLDGLKPDPAPECEPNG